MPKKTGRPRVHQNESDRMRKRRLQAKADGKRAVNLFLTDKHKKMLDELCKDLGIPQAEAVSYLLECAYDEELPNLTHYPDSASDQETYCQLSDS